MASHDFLSGMKSLIVCGLRNLSVVLDSKAPALLKVQLWVVKSVWNKEKRSCAMTALDTLTRENN
jgi:hypothetical protein